VRSVIYKLEKLQDEKSIEKNPFNENRNVYVTVLISTWKLVCNKNIVTI